MSGVSPGAPVAAPVPAAVVASSVPAPAPAAVEAPAPVAVAPEAPSAPAAAPSVSVPAPVSEGSPAAAPAAPAHEFVPSVMEQGRTDQAAQADPAKPAEPPAVKAEDAKAEAGAAPLAEPGPAEAAPVVYEFTFPEGINPSELNQERFDNFKAALGESKVSKESAQKFFDMHTSEIRDVANRVAENQWNVFIRQQEENQTRLKRDSEIGGTPEKFDASMLICGAAMEQVMPNPQERQALWDELKVSGAGNMLHVVKFVKRVGELFAREGTPVVAPPPRGQPQGQGQRGVGRFKQSKTPGWDSPP